MLTYKSPGGAIFYIVDMIFGGKDSRAFNLGNSSESPMLYMLFFMACFIIKIHLLNMLINVMRTIFAERA